MWRWLLLWSLRRVDAVAAWLRKRLRLDEPGALVWETNSDTDTRTIVEADGYGGGTAAEVQDLGGCDRLVLRHVKFDDLTQACAEACRWTGQMGDSS